MSCIVAPQIESTKIFLRENNVKQRFDNLLNSACSVVVYAEEIFTVSGMSLGCGSECFFLHEVIHNTNKVSESCSVHLCNFIGNKSA